MVGILALEAAAGHRTSATDTRGALRYILFQPFGRLVLFAIGFGLIGYVMWRFIGAIRNPEQNNALTRVGNAMSGLLYGSLSYFAFRLLIGDRQPDAEMEKSTTAEVLSFPFGDLAVLLAALTIFGVAVYQFWTAYTCHFLKKQSTGNVPAPLGRWVKPIGRFGIAARGVVFVMIAYFFLRAAIEHNPQEAGGIKQALLNLSYLPSWAPYCVAAGLVAYGFFGVIQARTRRIYSDLP